MQRDFKAEKCKLGRRVPAYNAWHRPRRGSEIGERFMSACLGCDRRPTPGGLESRLKRETRDGRWHRGERDMTVGRGVLLTVVLFACAPGKPSPAVLCGPYVPIGPFVGDPSNCSAETCAVLCIDSWCGAATDGFYCEACERWDDFKSSEDCPECDLKERGGSESLECDWPH